MRWGYLLFALIGAVLPYSQLVPWVLVHGLNLSLMLKELFSSNVGAFFGFDVFISAVVLIGFIRREGAAQKVTMLWLPIAATCLIGVSCGLPLFLYLRETQRARAPAH